MQPFRDDTPTPDRVRAALQAELHPSFEDDAAAFAGADRWFERALARVERPSWLDPFARKAWQRARERVMAEPPRIETGTLVACPIWLCEAEDDANDVWELAWCLLGRSDTVGSQAAALGSEALAVVAEARVTVAWARSVAMSRAYAPGFPSVERFEPFAVVRHQVVRVDEVTRVRRVELTAPPRRSVGPWASDAEAAFDVAVLEAGDRAKLDEMLRRARG